MGATGPVNDWLRTQGRFAVALTGLGVRSYRLDEDDACSLAWECLWRAYTTHDPAKGRSLSSWVIYLFRMRCLEVLALRRRRARGLDTLSLDGVRGLTDGDGRHHVRVRIAREQAAPCLICKTTGGRTRRSGKAERLQGMCYGCYARETRLRLTGGGA